MCMNYNIFILQSSKHVVEGNKFEWHGALMTHVSRSDLYQRYKLSTGGVKKGS